MTGRVPRPKPCGSCPYRKDVPPGVWDPSEYVKLRMYDKATGDQPLAEFLCHLADGHVCSGWLGHSDPGELMAVRLGVACGHLDESCYEYKTDVTLFASGAEAADHGLSQIQDPPPEARAVITKLGNARKALRSKSKTRR